MRRKIGIMLGVALLVAGLAAPAGAKKGGHPGPPSGTGLEVTVEPRSGYMSANSIGDQILFDVTVTNSSGGELSSVDVKFSNSPDFTGGGGTFDNVATFDLADGMSWTAVLTYLVGDGDFTELPFSTQTDVTVGTVTATAGDVNDSNDAIMSAYRVKVCSVVGGVVHFGPNAEYSECSFTAGPDESWTMKTTPAQPPHGKRVPGGATVRDGIPGNWCMSGDSTYDETTNTVTQTVYFPLAAEDGNIVCLHGGAGGDTMLVRNADTFYLATWKDNAVTLKLTQPTP